MPTEHKFGKHQVILNLIYTASYNLPSVAGLDLTLTGHIFNALDDVFVQDAVDNSQYNGYGDKLHLPHNAEVFLGTPRYANIGLTVNF